MKKTLFTALCAFALIIGLSSCSTDDSSPNKNNQTFSDENLSIRMNSVQWDPIDMGKSKVVISEQQPGKVTVELHSILQEAPLLRVACEKNGLGNGSLYSIEGEFDSPYFEIDLEGTVSDQKLDLRIEYEADYDITGKWMLAATSGEHLNIPMEIPSLSLDIRLPEDSSLTIDSDPLPSEEELQALLYEFNTMACSFGTLVDALEFSEAGYVNVYLTPEGQEMMNIQNSELHGFAQYYTQDYLYLYARTSLLMATAGSLSKASQPQQPDVPFFQLKLNYDLTGQNLRIYVDKALLSNYIDSIQELMQNMNPDDLATLLALIGGDPSDMAGLAEEIAYLLMILDEIDTVLQHPDTYILAEINLIPWTPGNRPWTGIL